MTRRLPLTPLWIAGHLAVVAAAFLTISLGLWQLDRLDQRQEANTFIRSRISDRVPLPGEGWSTGRAGELSYKGVSATGQYATGRDVLVRYRSFEGLPGYHVVTPLVTADGPVLVNRGWIPLDRERDAPGAAGRHGGGHGVAGAVAPQPGAARARPGPTGTTTPPASSPTCRPRSCARSWATTACTT